MKIEMTEGCTCDALDINGIPETELSDTEREKAWEKVLSYLKKEGNPDDLNELLQWVMPRYGISEHQYTCSQCGDSVYVTSLDF